jgi:predicted nucleotidyltransferase
LFGQPERSFFANELIGLTGSGSGAVQRELKRLVASGLVTVSPIGNQKHFQANPASPIFEELQSLVVKTVGLADPIRASLEPISSRIGLALIYGSVASGRDTAASDVDLLVVADGLTLEELYRELATAENALDRKIHPTLYTSQEFSKRRKARHPFVTKVLEGDKIVLLGNSDDPSATR